MPTAFDPAGLLDLSRAKRTAFYDLPKGLGAYRPKRDSVEHNVLFAEPPSFEDLTALKEAKPFDPSLYYCFGSLLGGLPSGPAVVMGMFRCQGKEEVVLRLYGPQRPSEGQPLSARYYVLSRGHAQLAKDKQWVSKDAPLWLALYAAAYYSLIEDRKTFYRRQDLGGADNAAWLVLYGKDSSRAKYPKEEEDSGAGGSDGGSGSGGSGSLLAQVMGNEDGAVNLDLYRNSMTMLDAKVQKKYCKAWESFLDKLPYVPATGLRMGLRPAAVQSCSAMDKWLRSKPGLTDEQIGLLLLYLEANGAIAEAGKQRYHKGERALWEGVRQTLLRRSPCALTVRKDSPLLAVLPDRKDKEEEESDAGRTWEVVAVGSLDLPAGKEEARQLRYVAVLDRSGGGRKFVWEPIDKERAQHRLAVKPSKKGEFWIELDQIMTEVDRIYVGTAATVALANLEDGKTFVLSGERNFKLDWKLP